jgi:hypothetical protein
MRFHARHFGSGVWGVFDAGVMGWRATALSEDEAHQQAADLNVIFSQYGQRDQVDRLEVKPPIEVESATWSAAGELDYWIKERHEWWGRTRSRRTSDVDQGLQIFAVQVLSINRVKIDSGAHTQSELDH